MSENIYCAAGVSPIEDLMRGHGVLHRVLLIYAEINKRLKNGCCVNYSVIYRAALQTAEIAKVFIEDYHQELENKYIFPLFKEDESFVPVINTLLEQHRAANRITSDILRVLERGVPNNAARPRLLCLTESYIRMYRPHSAREDTFIFPEVHRLISAEKWNELGDNFEELEQERFGKNGFEAIAEKLSETEKALGIHNLGQFTPRFLAR